MLTADELFSDGKLVPLHLSPSLPKPDNTPLDPVSSAIGSLSNLSISSPKAPKCSSRWRHIFTLNPKKTRNSKPQARPVKATLKPLIRDSDSDSLSFTSSRLSLSSTSSDSSEPPRFSLEPDNPGSNRNPNRVRTRPVKRSIADAESPRMNASGKVVFCSSLERSSSSPSSFNNGSRVRVRAREMMNRSYSANRVLNVPVCRNVGSGFGLFSSGGKKDVTGKSKMKVKREGL